MRRLVLLVIMAVFLGMSCEDGPTLRPRFSTNPDNPDDSISDTSSDTTADTTVDTTNDTNREDTLPADSSDCHDHDEDGRGGDDSNPHHTHEENGHGNDGDCDDG